MSRILVTGASGFVGRAVIAGLAESGQTVRAAVRRPPAPPFAAAVEVAEHGDLAATVDWRPLLAEVDQVVHLAGIAHSGRHTAPELYDRVNRDATAQLARAAAQAGVRRLVFVSSIRAQVGSFADHALTEDDPAAPTNAYGRSKLAAEAAIRDAGAPFTILRPVLLYGPGVKGNFALLMRAVESRWPLPLKDFGNRRSLLGIDNFVAALQFVLSAPGTVGETYIVADPGIPPRFSDVAAILREARGRRPRIWPLPTRYIETPLRMIGRNELWMRFGGNLRVDTGKLIGAGWQPVHDTRSGLTRLALASSPQVEVR